MAPKFYSPPSRCHGMPFGYAPEAEHVKLLFPAENVGYDFAEVVVKRNAARKLDLMIDDHIVVLLTPYYDSELQVNADEEESGSSYLSCAPLFPSSSSSSLALSSHPLPSSSSPHARSRATIVRIEMTNRAVSSLQPEPYYRHRSEVIRETIGPYEVKPQLEGREKRQQEKKDNVRPRSSPATQRILNHRPDTSRWGQHKHPL